jgi:transcriptional regulator with XRE-family HTH domain
MPKPTLQHRVARTVRRLREARGLSQEAFAQVVGVHRTTMGRIERGAYDLSLSTLEQIAVALELRLSELLAEAEAADLRRR